MENLGVFLLRVLTVSAGCSAVLVPVLLLAPRLQRRVSARSFYVIFLLLAVRLAVPVEISLPKPAVRVSVPDYTVSVPAPRPAEVQVQPAPEGVSAAPAPVQVLPAAPVETNSAPAVRKVPVTAILGMVWAVGALGCILWAVGSFLLARRRLMGSARSAPPEETALLNALRSELGIRRPVRLCQSALAPGPLALGLLRPVIVLPAGSCGKGLEIILRHELTHIRRWDVAYKLVLSLACAVNWFNPLVWRMDRAAGRNLELCCDDETARGLTEAGRKEYGRVLLAAAGTARALPFTTCFSDGKEQMMSRMLNLFTRKKNSAALVCLVLAAALLAGGLVACERANGSEIAVSPENQARRALFQTYFHENYSEDTASVVLADLTGDGLDEMLVLTIYGSYYGGDGEVLSLREGMEPDFFGWGHWEIYGVREGEVAALNSLRDIGGVHTGWGQQYLVPQETGFAVLEYDPYEGQGLANHSYRLSRLTEEGEWTQLDSGEVFFSLTADVEEIWKDGVAMHFTPLADDGPPITRVIKFSTEEEIDSFRSRVRDCGSSGVPLLIYNGDVGVLAYLNMAPADAFAGKAETVSDLRNSVSASGGLASYLLPAVVPATPEEALDALEKNIYMNETGVVELFVPDYDGTWDIALVCQRLVGWRGEGPEGEDEPVYSTLRYGEENAWDPGMLYRIRPRGGDVKDLTVEARVTASDGTVAERSITLLHEEWMPGALWGVKEEGE